MMMLKSHLAIVDDATTILEAELGEGRDRNNVETLCQLFQHTGQRWLGSGEVAAPP
jgi:hypothetical protein